MAVLAIRAVFGSPSLRASLPSASSACIRFARAHIGCRLTAQASERNANLGFVSLVELKDIPTTDCYFLPYSD